MIICTFIDPRDSSGQVYLLDISDSRLYFASINEEHEGLETV